MQNLNNLVADKLGFQVFITFGGEDKDITFLSAAAGVLLIVSLFV